MPRSKIYGHHRKRKQDQDPIFIELQANVHNQRVLAFKKGRDGILSQQGRLCVPMVDLLQQRIMEETRTSLYFIHPESTKMYYNLSDMYWQSSMKKGIAEFVAKCVNGQQFKVQKQRAGGLSQIYRNIGMQVRDD